MTTLLTRIFRDRCVACQVDQGRMCQCEGAARIRNGRRVRSRRQLTAGQWWVLILLGLACFWYGVLTALGRALS